MTLAATATWRAKANTVVRPELLTVITVAGALLFAHWWTYSAVPHMTYSLWGPYFLGPLGWLGAAAVAFLWLDTLPETEGEHAVGRGTVCTIALIIGIFIVALQVVAGMVAELGKSNLAPPLDRVPHQLLFVTAPLLATETARCVLLRSLVRVNATLALIGTTLFLAVLQYNYAALMTAHSVASVDFWAATFIPLAAMGLVAGFFALYGGVRASLLLAAPLLYFTYFSPFLLVADWPIRALVGVAGPAIGLWIAESMFAAEGILEEESKPGRFHAPSAAWVVTAVIGLTIFWFSFGFFGFRPAFIPTGSMEPHINRGDLVLIGPVSPKDIAIGDVVMYQPSGTRTRVLHRIVGIDHDADGKLVFTFKGDNNNVADPLAVTEKQIIGRYLGKVPKLGWVPIEFDRAIQAVVG